MARLEKIRCIVCGSLRGFDAFGLDSRGRSATEPYYELQLGIQEIGGRGRCSWTFEDAPFEAAMALRDRLKAALEQITADLRAAGHEPEADGSSGDD